MPLKQSVYVDRDKTLPSRGATFTRLSTTLTPWTGQRWSLPEQIKKRKIFPGVWIDDEEMKRLWQSFFSKYMLEFPFSKEAGGPHRYYLENPFFGPGDAFILFSMLLHARPSRVVEIGSGFSSACLLDTIEFAGLTTQCTFIEPYPQRLKSLLTPSDLDRCSVIEAPVQSVDPDFFLSLGSGDILFIDSTHVLKACSDVAFELFEILPRLHPGVLVHFHDMFWPFEYPTGWLIDKQYSWNELYAVRAFLINNEKFKIVFFNDYFHRRHVDLITNCPLPATLKGMRLHCGGSLWLQRL